MPWNAAVVVVDKVENLTPKDKPCITISYQHVYETKPRNYLNLAFKCHDFVFKLHHITYFKLDLKHGYFAIELHLEDRYILAFIVLGIGQVQPTRVMQGSTNLGFSFTKLINITLGEIPEPNQEQLLLTEVKELEKGVQPYTDNLFICHKSFESRLKYLKTRLLLRLDWANLRLAFKKLRLFTNEMVVLEIKHQVGKKIGILDQRIEKILRWSTSKN